MCCPSSSFSPALNRGSNCFPYIPFLLIYPSMKYNSFFFVITSQQGLKFHLWSAITLTAFTAVSPTTQLLLILCLHLWFCLPKCRTLHLWLVNFVSLFLDSFFNLSRAFEFWSFWFFQSAFKSSSLALSKIVIGLFFILLPRSLIRIFLQHQKAAEDPNLNCPPRLKIPLSVLCFCIAWCRGGLTIKYALHHRVKLTSCSTKLSS